MLDVINSHELTSEENDGCCADLTSVSRELNIAIGYADLVSVSRELSRGEQGECRADLASVLSLGD